MAKFVNDPESKNIRKVESFSLRLYTLWGLFSLILLGVLSVSCHHPDELPLPPRVTEGKRDYVWSTDTLSRDGSFQTNMVAIWASSSSDVYTVGWNDRSTRGCMYHYNGQKWDWVHLSNLDGGLISVGIQLSAVYGFSKSDIWAVGSKIRGNASPPPQTIDSTYILHFDGSSWRETSIERIRGRLITVWGDSPTDVWAGGDNGSLYHYDGKKWNRMLGSSDNFFCSFGGFSAHEIYSALGRSLAGPDTIGVYRYYFSSWNGTSWALKDSFDNNNPSWKFWNSIYTTTQGTLYSAGRGVFRFETVSAQWKTILKTDENVGLQLNGSGENNIYAVGFGWLIYHWNGIDWKRIPCSLSQVGYFSDTWSNNQETFVVGNDGNRTFILHGK